MTKSQRTAAILATALALTLPARAFAYEWLYVADGKILMGTTGEEEGDTDFRATCKAPGQAELGVGASQDVGTGKGEAVSLTLASTAHTVKLDGKSRESMNFQMTGGVELQTTVDAKHAVFQLLADPGVIKVTGTAKPMNMPAAGRGKATAAFTKACFGK